MNARIEAREPVDLDDDLTYTETVRACNTEIVQTGTRRLRYIAAGFVVAVALFSLHLAHQYGQASIGMIVSLVGVMLGAALPIDRRVSVAAGLVALLLIAGAGR